MGIQRARALPDDPEGFLRHVPLHRPPHLPGRQCPQVVGHWTLWRPSRAATLRKPCDPEDWQRSLAVGVVPFVILLSLGRIWLQPSQRPQRSETGA